MSRKLVLGITGASGVIYGVRLLHVLRAAGCEVHLSISASGATVMHQELGLDIDLRRFDVSALVLPSTFAAGGSSASVKVASSATSAPLHYHHFEDLLAPIASGSFLTDGMVICACS